MSLCKTREPGFTGVFCCGSTSTIAGILPSPPLPPPHTSTQHNFEVLSSFYTKMKPSTLHNGLTVHLRTLQFPPRVIESQSTWHPHGHHRKKSLSDLHLSLAFANPTILQAITFLSLKKTQRCTLSPSLYSSHTQPPPNPYKHLCRRTFKAAYATQPIAPITTHFVCFPLYEYRSYVLSVGSVIMKARSSAVVTPSLRVAVRFI